jgi:hypothetical protein
MYWVEGIFICSVKNPQGLTTDKWIKKMWYLYKKNKILSFAGK